MKPPKHHFMAIKTPGFLKKGDEIRIVATARFIEKEILEGSKEWLESFGFKVSFGKHVFGREHQFSGSDAERLSDLNAALADANCRAILCARGGYGTVRLLDGLDLESLRKKPKWIIGYSDITALLNHIYAAGIAGIHGTMPIDFGEKKAESLNSLIALLRGNLPELKAPAQPLNRSGTAKGDLIGGNLSVIYSLLGSGSQLRTAGKILFLEDLDEYLYHIDRMMQALKRAGMLDDLAGLVVGGMSDMNDNAVPFGKSAEEIIADAVSEYDFPLAFALPSGHIDTNMPWIHGACATLEVSAAGGASVRFDLED